MEVDFDKQIDTILRDLAKGNAVAESPPPAHLDADELSAFAENVLPPKARLRAMEHLADCSNCRKTYSTFVSLNNETESETIHEEVKTIAAIPEIPWYRKLFAFPQLSYLMGALALVLTGAIGLLLFQNSQDSGSSLAMKEPAAEKAKGPSGASSEGDVADNGSFSTNSANTIANSVAVPASNVSSSVTNSASNISVNPASPTTTAASPADSAPKPMATPLAVGVANTATSSDAPTADKLAEKERDRNAKEDAVVVKGGETSQPSNEVSATPTPSAGQSRSDDNMSRSQAMEQQNVARNSQTLYPDTGNEAKRSTPSAAPVPSKKSAQREDSGSGNYAKDEEVRKNKAEPKLKSTPKPTVFKDVAGKSFRNVNGIWTDTNYKGGNTINVKRGTDEYKKLDSGLRSTADYLGGTVIVVWKSKNYKIQ